MCKMREEKREVVNTPKVLLDNKDFMVIDKPAGWIVNDAKTAKGQPIIQGWLNKFDYPIAKSHDLRAGIVHRLDKETSGCLIIAKTEKAFYALQAEFKDRVVKKRYVALVHGTPEPDHGEVNAPIGRLPWRRDRFGVLAEGRDAKTNYKVIIKYKDYSLVEFSPYTGRTHQIRVHAKYLGTPVVSDIFYAGRKTARKDRAFCPRLFLHAKYINFLDPESGDRVEVESPLPQELKKALSSLEKVSSNR